MKPYIEIFAALLTPTIAIVTTYIAVQQYRNNRLKHRLDLYDRRMAIYKSARQFLYEFFNRPGGVAGKTQTLFFEHVQESYFLFDKNIHELLVEIYMKHKELEHLGKVSKSEALHTGEENEKIDMEINATSRWMVEQFGVLLEKFTPYLKLEAMR